MATLHGATALGWGRETGSLTEGKSADMVILPLPNADRADPYALVLESTLPLESVFFRGKFSYAADNMDLQKTKEP